MNQITQNPYSISYSFYQICNNDKLEIQTTEYKYLLAKARINLSPFNLQIFLHPKYHPILEKNQNQIENLLLLQNIINNSPNSTKYKQYAIYNSSPLLRFDIPNKRKHTQAIFWLIISQPFREKNISLNQILPSILDIQYVQFHEINGIAQDSDPNTLQNYQDALTSLIQNKLVKQIQQNTTPNPKKLERIQKTYQITKKGIQFLSKNKPRQIPFQQWIQMSPFEKEYLART